MLANAPIIWASKLQPMMSLSTYKTKYSAIITARKEAIWLSYLLADLELYKTTPITIHTNSQSALKLANNPQFHAQTKYINVKHY